MKTQVKRLQHEMLLSKSTSELLAAASAKRDRLFPTVITYSPKVFLPLTMACRDRCGYCTFAKPVSNTDKAYLSLEDMLVTAHKGVQAGCHEALFTLGESPESRFPLAALWLKEHGYSSTVDYLVDACTTISKETGLLAHSNAGALSKTELSRLRKVAVSQGSMIESLRGDLAAHALSPDKSPSRRLDTLNSAGELAIAFTTGILAGIGEDERDRLVALEAIKESHLKYGHIQEVIIQNFVPKAATAMRHWAPLSMEAHLRAIALGRLVLPDDIHVQAPPNLSLDMALLLSAGIDDWGGISPVTCDYVNPELPWPSLSQLRSVTQQQGFNLVPRLAIYPEDVGAPQTWLDPGLHSIVLAASDSQGYARDDQWFSGATVPPPIIVCSQTSTHHSPGTAPDVAQNEISALACEPLESQSSIALTPREALGESREHNRKTHNPPNRSAADACNSDARNSDRSSRHGRNTEISEILSGAASGDRLGESEIVALFGARGTDVSLIAKVADSMRYQAVGDAVTWVANRNINYTNICTYGCKFCAFSRGPRSLGLRGDPYLLDMDEISRRVCQAEALGATEVCLQGGIHPSFDGEHYIKVLQAVRRASPSIHIHAFTALEIWEGARRLQEPLESYLIRLKHAGLRTLPGTAAEVLDDEVRAILCPDKIDSDTWLEVHKVAHGIGLRSNVTIMFGSVEGARSWAKHLISTASLQEQTGGFTEFVPLPFVHMAAPIFLNGKARKGPTFREAILMHSVGRIVYSGLIDNIQASWVKMGMRGVSQLLQAGCNDLGGTLMDENISRAAGASHGQAVTKASLEELVRPLGRHLLQRTTLYESVEQIQRDGNPLMSDIQL